MTTEKQIFVLAGNHEQYLNFLAERNRPSGDAIYVENSSMLWGCQNIVLYRYGTWHERKDLVEINEVLKAIALHGSVEEYIISKEEPSGTDIKVNEMSKEFKPFTDYELEEAVKFGKLSGRGIDYILLSRKQYDAYFERKDSAYSRFFKRIEVLYSKGGGFPISDNRVVLCFDLGEKDYVVWTRPTSLSTRPVKEFPATSIMGAIEDTGAVLLFTKSELLTVVNNALAATTKTPRYAIISDVQFRGLFENLDILEEFNILTGCRFIARPNNALLKKAVSGTDRDIEDSILVAWWDSSEKHVIGERLYTREFGRCFDVRPIPIPMVLYEKGSKESDMKGHPKVEKELSYKYTYSGVFELPGMSVNGTRPFVFEIPEPLPKDEWEVCARYKHKWGSDCYVKSLGIFRNQLLFFRLTETGECLEFNETDGKLIAQEYYKRALLEHAKCLSWVKWQKKPKKREVKEKPANVLRTYLS